MEKNEFFIMGETPKPITQVIEDVKIGIEENGFELQQVIKLSDRFNERDLELYEYYVVELCNLKMAHRALQNDPTRGAIMPQRILIYDKGGSTNISYMKLGSETLKKIYPNSNIASISRRLVEMIERIIQRGLSV